ncbi:MAG TPA: hypothetical protein VJN92_21150 [Candidatus Acidoferrum sp.]|nr:hypothetical protein [Candidatus Acidoferrum sp.]
MATDGVSLLAVGYRMNSANDGNVGVAFAFHDAGQSADFLGSVDMGTTNSLFESAAVASSAVIGGSVGANAIAVTLNPQTGQTNSVVQCPIGTFTAMARDSARIYYVSGSSLLVGDLAGAIDCNQTPITITGTRLGSIRRIAVGVNNHLLAVGDYVDFSTAQFRSGFVTDIDIATGNTVWNRADDELAGVQGLSVAVTMENETTVVYVSGTQWPSLRANDMFVTKLAEMDGQTISPWPVKVDTGSSLPVNFAADVVLNTSAFGGIVLAGQAPKLDAPSPVSTEAFFAGLAPDGKVLWTFRDNLAVGNSDGIQAAAGAGSAIYVTGTFGQFTSASIGLVAKFTLE